MTRPAAIVTGGSRGIGLAVARVLAKEGYALTLAARRRDRLLATAATLSDEGFEVEPVAGDLRDAETVSEVVRRHSDRYGRLDVLVNNAGLGISSPIDDVELKHVDLQLDVNLRAMILFSHEALPLLRRAGAEHGNAVVLNVASISAKVGTRHLAVYSATKAGMVGFTQAMNDELYDAGIKCCALCPAYVDTELAGYIHDRIPAAEMIRTTDIAEVVRALLHLSPFCLVPEVIFARRGDSSAP